MIIGHRMSVVGTPTCCLLAWAGLPHNVQELRVTSHKAETGKNCIALTHTVSEVTQCHLHSLTVKAAVTNAAQIQGRDKDIPS